MSWERTQTGKAAARIIPHGAASEKTPSDLHI